MSAKEGSSSLDKIERILRIVESIAVTASAVVAIKYMTVGDPPPREIPRDTVKPILVDLCKIRANLRGMEKAVKEREAQLYCNCWISTLKLCERITSYFEKRSMGPYEKLWDKIKAEFLYIDLTDTIMLKSFISAIDWFIVGGTISSLVRFYPEQAGAWEYWKGLWREYQLKAPIT